MFGILFCMFMGKVAYNQAQTPKQLATYWLMPVVDEPWPVEVYNLDATNCWQLESYRADIMHDPNQPFIYVPIDDKTMVRINVKMRKVNYTDLALN